MCVMIGYVIRVYMAGCHATGLLYFSIIVFDTWKVYTLHWCQKWSGMAHDSIVLPDVSVENFEHAWKRFRLAATAKQWQEEKQLQILPTLLRGNLVEYYMDLSEEEKKSLEGLKQALERKAGIKKDPLVAAKYFNSRHQDDRERVVDYATQLRKAFKEAYPDENVGSAVLLQTFLSGLRPSIARQVVLKGRPTTMDKAIEEAVTVEEALRFGGTNSAEEVPVHAVHSKDSGAEIEQLKMMLERMSQRFETFEQQLKGLDTGMATKVEDNMKRKVGSPSGGQYRGNWKKNTRGCFLCGEEGHWKRECPLNFSKSARAVDGGWLVRK